MILSWNQMTRRIFLHSCFFLLIVALTACSSPGSTHTSSHSTTPRPNSPTSAPTATLKTYTGTNFSLTYPPNWQAQGGGNQVIFQDAQGLNALTVVIVPNPGGVKSADSLADTTFPAIEK